MYLTDRFTERQMMILNQPERSKRDHAERHDHARIDDLNLATKKSGTVRDLSPGWLAIRARTCARIAEHGVGDED
jgi:hypothetical protein